ncbi:xanthine dehydrogenase YagS FAD-binding subunit [Actinopolyspora biskrensis]|uniref:Xanthine dehydrogenase YagS FAD-binding subunit n=1 Tax=Actinopolyspora biskrensis TaxID=1470178 RepID=A0A852YRI1_9ACTN|nr:xanthine dehydrogenase family protein subunit M [Actinopolyspora biskrensis]NYH77844.1 xanthine dehydrogenase YagS FAD-binding subunit [Actinopolyspora biskrensis]
MIPFEYRRAEDTDSAVAAVEEAPRAVFLAGGTNLVDHLKLGITAPEELVDVTALPLDTIESTPDGGLRIGATVRNSDLAASPPVRERYRALSLALLSGASAQLRNRATTGGNLLQRTRCPYFQEVTTPCNKRSPGTGCSALHGHNKNHAVLGASDSCVATHPSDMAVAMAALDGTVHVRSSRDERTIPVTELHRLPGEQPHRDTVLERGELITAVDLPPLPEGTYTAYRKVRERASYAFALVSVAAVLRVANGVIDDVRLAFGGLAHKPWRAGTAEERLRGAIPEEATFREAAEAELSVARPLADNAFKIPLARNTLGAVLRDLTTEVLR